MSLNVSEIRSLESFLLDGLSTALDNNTAFALWYDQASHRQYLLLSEHPREWSVNEPLESLEKGFVIHPFSTAQHKALFLPADKLVVYNPHTFIVEEGEELLKKNSQQDWKRYLKPETKTEDEDTFYSVVDEGVAAIERGEFKKVVVARRKFKPYEESIDSLAVFYKNLREAYPSAFVCIFYHPETGMWVCASPELLVQQTSDEIFRTISLAGTQPLREGQDKKNVSWTQKEIEEQALVSRYIINCFKTIRVREFEEEGPRTIQAGNLLHLRTDFSINMQEVKYPMLTSTLLRLLHPTSAVCGMPLEESRAFLKKNENFDRAYFSGFLGPVHIANETSIYVLLRCAQFMQNGAWLYAGAGITQDSVTNREWRETELKMDVIGRFL